MNMDASDRLWREMVETRAEQIRTNPSLTSFPGSDKLQGQGGRKVSRKLKDLLSQQGFITQTLTKGKIVTDMNTGEQTEVVVKEDKTVGSLIPLAGAYLDNEMNVLLIGLHGTGKTQSILDITKARGMKMKYYSCSTLDPYTDLVGVPVPELSFNDDGTPRLDSFGQQIKELKMVRPREVDEAEFIFFDEFNRADPKTLNAIFEIIQFKSINGEPLKNLKCCWAAMNPPEDQYQVEEVDPALLDRFDVYIPIDPHPSPEYMAKFMPLQVAQALTLWWTQHGRDKKARAAKVVSGNNQSAAGESRIDYISPRRLLKIGLVWVATKNAKAVKAALPYGGQFDHGKLMEMLKAADKGGSFKAEDIGDAASDEITYTPSWLALNKNTVAELLKKNPNALETHRKVLETLENGVGGLPLVEKFAEVLDAIQPTLLEGFFAGMPDVKKSGMRTGFSNYYKTNQAKAEGMKNLYKVLQKGARDGVLPIIP